MTDQEITFENFDMFERGKLAERLTTVISKFYPFYDESFVLSLNAKFGSGKTTFLQMWKHQLESQRYKVIYINAWKTDFDEEPLIPIISSFINAIGEGKGYVKALNALATVLGAAAATTNQIVKHATGIDADETAQRLESEKKKSLKEQGHEIYQEYSFKEHAYNILREKLPEYIENLGKKPLIVLVDELDRVRPDYAVKFLEAIKHIFSVQGICFVLAVDRFQLEASVKQLYGNIDFENYYLRFITREADLPEATKVNLTPFLEHKSSLFFDEKRDTGITFAFESKHQREILSFMETVCRVFHFTPRQIESLFRIFSQLMAVSQDDKLSKRQWIDAATLLIAIFIKDRELYKQIGTSTLSALELIKFLKTLDYNLPPHNSYESNITLLAFSFFLRDGLATVETDLIANTCLDRDFMDMYSTDPIENKKKVISNLSMTIDGRVGIHQKSGFQHIYEIMEEWREFVE